MSDQVCPKCGKVHQKSIPTGIKMDKEDADDMSLILNKLNCAQQAADIKNIPEGVSQEVVSKFVQATLEVLSNYKWLEEDWWKRAIIKYNLPKEDLLRISIDTNAMEFVYINHE